ncbi:hypothetical protein C8R44DRAFT_738416 [Mycena epipterygia]|nr:hypothetical protein C8R44DRAFT_738416 [Mycena epipterygia]
MTSGESVGAGDDAYSVDEGIYIEIQDSVDLLRDVIPLRVHVYGGAAETKTLGFRVQGVRFLFCAGRIGRKKGRDGEWAPLTTSSSPPRPRGRASILGEDAGADERDALRATSVRTALMDGAKWRMRGADGHRYRGLERVLDCGHDSVPPRNTLAARVSQTRTDASRAWARSASSQGRREIKEIEA